MPAWVEAILLGIIQGLTEFLPVSSSGHLELAKYFLGDQRLSDSSMFMTVLLHFATALSTVFFFWSDIKSILTGIRGRDSQAYIIFILISMIPAVIIGLAFETIIESFFSGNVVLICGMLLVTAILLLFADFSKSKKKPLTNSSALIIGIAQAIAIIPGISRSGATVATSIMLGIDRNHAARFSFLMVIPLIFGKMAKDVLDGSLLTFAKGDLLYYFVGFTTALIVGYLTCKFMVGLIKRAQLRYFSLYCILISIATLSYYFIK